MRRPTWYACALCGPGVAVEDDGLCRGCGGGVTQEPIPQSALDALNPVAVRLYLAATRRMLQRLTRKLRKREAQLASAGLLKEGS